MCHRRRGGVPTSCAQTTEFVNFPYKSAEQDESTSFLKIWFQVPAIRVFLFGKEKKALIPPPEGSSVVGNRTTNHNKLNRAEESRRVHTAAAAVPWTQRNTLSLPPLDSIGFCAILRGMQTPADGWCRSLIMWALWGLYICLAMALTLARSDGPSGQGFSSLRVEALLSKMTLEDKVYSVV